MILAQGTDYEPDAFGAMAWTQPIHDATALNAAGRALVLGTAAPPGELQHAVQVITQWRSAHGYPLNSFQVGLRNRTRRVQGKNPAVSVAQRLKRLPAIEAKLTRFDTMRLAQMQDIGGCRSVVGSVQQVKKLVELCRTSRHKHALVREKDYFNEPKDDGYRSHHLVFCYHSDSPNTRAWNGIHIEIQVRTQLQHAWATAVETVDLFTGQALKSSLGQEDWRRFFFLMGDYIARMERLPHLFDGSIGVLRGEIKALAGELNVLSSLEGWAVARRTLRKSGLRADYYLLRLDAKSMQLTLHEFTAQEAGQALSLYAAAEKDIAGSTMKHAVLVRAGSESAVRTAYRGFFAETRRFTELVRTAIN